MLETWVTERPEVRYLVTTPMLPPATLRAPTCTPTASSLPTLRAPGDRG